MDESIGKIKELEKQNDKLSRENSQLKRSLRRCERLLQQVDKMAKANEKVNINLYNELDRLSKTVQEQADRLEVQAAQLAEWNRTLEQRVAEQLSELERVGRLKRFLSPQLAELIVSSEDEGILESHRREITVVFCDLRGFTAFSETGEPEEVMGVLREYHSAMGNLIFRFEGTLERFAGDGLMVFFNDPVPCADPAARAIRMAVAMRDSVRELSEKWRKRGHHLDLGVGIAQGYATLGKIGFEGRFDYAAIGTVTNLASRLCDEAQAGQILISQRICGVVEELVAVELVGELALKGLHRPVTAYNVLNLKGESKTP
jgi:adenylate cyclase